MRLVIIYEIDDDERLFYEWKRVNEKDKTLRIVIDFVKSLSGWERCILCGFIKYGYKRSDKTKVFFLQSINDEKNDSERKHMTVKFYVSEKETTTREEFCEAVDVLLKNTSNHIRKYFKDFAMNPETSDADLDEVMNTMLRENIDSQSLAKN